MLRKLTNRQQDELLLQLTDAVIIGEPRYRVTVGSSTLFESTRAYGLVDGTRRVRHWNAARPELLVLQR